MKGKLLFIILIIFDYSVSFSQDGSNMRYINIEDVDSSYIGKEVHLDFYNLSFFSKRLDTITIVVNNKTVLFTEYRSDNGFNNWFSEQYLEEISNSTEKLRLVKSIVKEVTADSILVTNHFEFFIGKKGEEKLFHHDYWFPKSIIVQILVHSKQCC